MEESAWASPKALSAHESWHLELAHDTFIQFLLSFGFSNALPHNLVWTDWAKAVCVAKVEETSLNPKHVWTACFSVGGSGHDRQHHRVRHEIKLISTLGLKTQSAQHESVAFNYSALMTSKQWDCFVWVPSKTLSTLRSICRRPFRTQGAKKKAWRPLHQTAVRLGKYKQALA